MRSPPGARRSRSPSGGSRRSSRRRREPARRRPPADRSGPAPASPARCASRARPARVRPARPAGLPRGRSGPSGSASARRVPGRPSPRRGMECRCRPAGHRPGTRPAPSCTGPQRARAAREWRAVPFRGRVPSGPRCPGGAIDPRLGLRETTTAQQLGTEDHVGVPGGPALLPAVPGGQLDRLPAEVLSDRTRDGSRRRRHGPGRGAPERDDRCGAHGSHRQPGAVLPAPGADRLPAGSRGPAPRPRRRRRFCRDRSPREPAGPGRSPGRAASLPSTRACSRSASLDIAARSPRRRAAESVESASRTWNRSRRPGGTASQLFLART